MRPLQEVISRGQQCGAQSFNCRLADVDAFLPVLAEEHAFIGQQLQVQFELGFCHRPVGTVG